MGLRFSRRITLAPGIRMNLSMSGISWSVGPRGASVSLGKRGTFANVGLPGSGLSYRTRLDGDGPQGRSSVRASVDAAVARGAERARRETELAGQVIEAEIEVRATGEVEVISPDGSPLAGKAKTAFWEQRGTEVSQLLADHVLVSDAESKAVVDVYLDTPPPVFSVRFDPNPFAEATPALPTRRKARQAPVMQMPPELSLLERLSGSARQRREQMVAEASLAHGHDMAAWLQEADAAACANRDADNAHALALEAWTKKKVAHDQEQNYFSVNFEKLLRTHAGFMEQAFDDVLSAINWPRETLVSYQIDQMNDAISVDIDLPEIADMPSTQARLSVNGRRLLMKKVPKSEIERDYVRHVHGVILRVAGCAFATLPALKCVTISGYTQRVDSRGVKSDLYVLSSRIERARLARLDFDRLAQLDPVSAFDHFDTRRRLSGSGGMQSIEPFGAGP